MMAKNLPIGQWLWKIPYRFILDSISAWKSLFAGEAVYFLAILEAHLAFLKWLVINRKKSIFPKEQDAANSVAWYPGSVVWQYFIRGKENF